MRKALRFTSGLQHTFNILSFLSISIAFLQVDAFTCPYYDPDIVCKTSNPRQCNVNLDCPAGSTCCPYECEGTGCVPELCPDYEGQNVCKNEGQKRVNECQSSDDCGGKKSEHSVCCMRCGATVCVHHVLKEGLCPRATPRPLCPTEQGQGFIGCNSDDGCDGNEKCCPTECPWKECREPVKKGSCPELVALLPCHRTTSNSKSDQCSSDLGCDGNDKCCPTECNGLQCREPNLVKEGSCPGVHYSSEEDDAFELKCSRECQVDYDCQGSKKCCFNGCTMICS